jgi:hypothetical protein
MRPGNYPNGPNGMYGHPGMGMSGMGNGGPNQPMGNYGNMRMGMGQYNGQLGNGYMPGNGAPVSYFLQFNLLSM